MFKLNQCFTQKKKYLMKKCLVELKKNNLWQLSLWDWLKLNLQQIAPSVLKIHFSNLAYILAQRALNSKLWDVSCHIISIVSNDKAYWLYACLGFFSNWGRRVWSWSSSFLCNSLAALKKREAGFSWNWKNEIERMYARLSLFCNMTRRYIFLILVWFFFKKIKQIISVLNRI